MPRTDPRETAVAVGLGVFGIEAYRLVVIGDGLVELAQAGPGKTAIEVRDRLFGVDLDGRVEIGDRLFELALVDEGQAAASQHGGVLAVGLVGLGESGDGLVVLASCHQRRGLLDGIIRRFRRDGWVLASGGDEQNRRRNDY